MLAAQAAVAVENARLYESATRWLTQLESLNEIVDALIVGGRAAQAARARRHAAARAGQGQARRDRDAVVRAATSSSARWPAKASRSSSGPCSSGGARSPGRVLDRGRSERVDSIIDDPEVDQEAGRRMGARTGLYVPLLLRGRPIGVLSTHDKEGSDPRFTDEDLRLAETLSARVAVAVDLSQRVARDALRTRRQRSGARA